MAMGNAARTLNLEIDHLVIERDGKADTMDHIGLIVSATNEEDLGMNKGYIEGGLAQVGTISTSSQSLGEVWMRIEA